MSFLKLPHEIISIINEYWLTSIKVKEIMKTLANECKSAWEKQTRFNNGKSKYNEIYSFNPLWHIEQRANPFSMHYLNKNTQSWDYKLMSLDSTYAYINIFNNPHSHNKIAGLKIIEWQNLLKQNGICYTGSNTYKELIAAYLHL